MQSKKHAIPPRVTQTSNNVCFANTTRVRFTVTKWKRHNTPNIHAGIFRKCPPLPRNESVSTRYIHPSPGTSLTLRLCNSLSHTFEYCNQHMCMYNKTKTCGYLKPRNPSMRAVCVPALPPRPGRAQQQTLCIYVLVCGYTPAQNKYIALKCSCG